jgi:hypothetical protein
MGGFEMSTENSTSEMPLEDILDNRDEMIRRILEYTREMYADNSISGEAGKKDLSIIENDYRSASIESLREAYFLHFPSDSPVVEKHMTTNFEQEDGEKTAKDKLFEQLNDGVRDILNSDKFKDYLKTSSRLFYNGYSMRNMLLIHLQKPDASYVNGYEAWKQYGRCVKQGAKGAKIIVPVYASERVKGGLYGQVKNGLKAELTKNPTAPHVSYKLGQSGYEFVQNRSNGLVGVRKDGKDRGFFKSDAELRKFIDTAILGKVPIYFNVSTVFDVKDVAVPEHLWVKSGFSKDEVVKDNLGKPIKNNKGQTKIINTPERQASFVEHIGTELAAQDPEKMNRLFVSLADVCAKRGYALEIRTPDNDEILKGGAEGYYTSHEKYDNPALSDDLKTALKEDFPNGVIVVNGELETTVQCSVLSHEIAHGDLHSKTNIEEIAKEMGVEKAEITMKLKETQAQAVAYGVCSMFGVEDTRFSFEYMAAYASGVELQELNQSLNVIHKEVQSLIKDIHVELDKAGYTPELVQKDGNTLNAETIEKVIGENLNFALEQEKLCNATLTEIAALSESLKQPPFWEYYQKYASRREESADVHHTPQFNTPYGVGDTFKAETGYPSLMRIESIDESRVNYSFVEEPSLSASSHYLQKEQFEKFVDDGSFTRFDPLSENSKHVLFHRLGDFYEVLGDNAPNVAKALDIAVTSRDVGLPQRVPLVGVPSHTIESYKSVLEDKGFNVTLTHNHAERYGDLINIVDNVKKNADQRLECVDIIKTEIAELRTLDTREAQNNCIDKIECAAKNIFYAANAYDNLRTGFQNVSELIHGSLKLDFEKDPKGTLSKLAADYPKLNELSDAQKNYLFSSKYIARESVILRNDERVGEFVDKACERANALPDCVSKSGVVVEISMCEQYTDKPIFEDGTICHPKIAEDILKQAEVQIQGLKKEHKAKGDYFPYVKCYLTVYDVFGSFSFETKIDIGDGEQKGLKDHMEQYLKGSEPSELVENFNKALMERGVKDKIFIPQLPDTDTEGRAVESNENLLSIADFNNDLAAFKETAEKTGAASPERGGKADKAKEVGG